MGNGISVLKPHCDSHLRRSDQIIRQTVEHLNKMAITFKRILVCFTSKRTSDLDSGFRIRDLRFEIREATFEIRDPRSEIRDLRFGIRDAGLYMF